MKDDAGKDIAPAGSRSHTLKIMIRLLQNPTLKALAIMLRQK